MRCCSRNPGWEPLAGRSTVSASARHRLCLRSWQPRLPCGWRREAALGSDTTVRCFMVREVGPCPRLVVRSRGVLLCQHVMRFTTKATDGVFECQALSCLWLSVTPWMVARQGSSVRGGSPRQEYWNGLPFHLGAFQVNWTLNNWETRETGNTWRKVDYLACSLKVLDG